MKEENYYKQQKYRDSQDILINWSLYRYTLWLNQIRLDLKSKFQMGTPGTNRRAEWTGFLTKYSELDLFTPQKLAS